MEHLSRLVGAAVIIAMIAVASLAQQTQGQGQPSAADEAQELAKKLSNPVASLISFPLQNNFDFRMGTGSGWRYTLNVQPVVLAPVKSDRYCHRKERWTVLDMKNEWKVIYPFEKK